MDTLGVVESKSIAAGVELADAMMKAASVELVSASTICSGRYMIYVSGEREAVQTAVHEASSSGRSLMGSFVIANIAPQVLAVLKKSTPVEEGSAIAVIESRTVSTSVVAADAAVKRAQVCIARFVSGQGINGKSYFVLSGDVAAVEEATQAAKEILGQNLIEAVVIARPNASVVRALTGGVR